MKEGKCYMKFKVSLKRWLAGLLVLVLVFTGIQVNNLVSTKAASFKEATSAQLTPDNLLMWDFKNFTYDKVWTNYEGFVLNDDLVEVEGMSNSAGVRSLLQEGASAGEGWKNALQWNSTVSYGTFLKNSMKESSGGISPSVIYKNIGKVVNGSSITQIDLKVTLTDWKVGIGTNSDRAYVCFSVCTPLKEDTFDDPSAIGIWPSCNVLEIEVKYEFFVAGTNTPIAVNGQFTQVDLDGKQYFAYTDDSNVDTILYSAKNDEVRDDGANHITTSTITDSDGVKWDMITASDYVTFPTPDKIDKYEAGYVSCVFGSEEPVSEVRFRFGTNYGGSEYRNSLGHYYFGIVPYTLATYDSPTPRKYIIDYKGEEVSSVGSEAYYNDGNTKVTYVVDVYIPRSLTHNYNYFAIEDTLNEVYKSNPNVKIYQDSNYAIDGTLGDGKPVTSWFGISKSSSGLIKATAGSNTLSEYKRDFFGHSYQMVITAEIDKEKLDSAVDRGIIDYTNEGYYKIPNNATCTVGLWEPDTSTYQTSTERTPKSTETVYAYYTEPVLDIEKRVLNSSNQRVDEATIAVGSTATYYIYVVNTNPIAEVYNLRVWDIIPKSLDPSTVSVTVDSAYVNGTSVKSYVTKDSDGLGYTFNKVFGKGNITRGVNSVTTSGDRVVLKVTGKVSTGYTDRNWGYATHHYTDEVIKDDALTDDGVEDFAVEITKEYNVKQMSLGGTAKAKITVAQNNANVDPNALFEIETISDTLYVWENESDVYSSLGYFRLAGKEPVIYVEGVNGSKKYITTSENVDIVPSGANWETSRYDILFYEPLYLKKGEKLVIEYDVTADVISYYEQYYHPMATYNKPVMNEVIVNDTQGTISGYYNKNLGVDVYYGELSEDAYLDVLEPQTKVTKVSDTTVYEVGELDDMHLAHYTVSLENIKEGTTSNVTFIDYFTVDIVGSSIQNYIDRFYNIIKDSVKITTEDGQDVTHLFSIGFYDKDSSLIPESIRNNSYFTINSPYDKVLIVDLLDAYNNGDWYINYGSPYYIEYDIPITNEDLVDIDVVNWAWLYDDNSTYLSCDDNVINVVKPELGIEKEVVNYWGTNPSFETLDSLDWSEEVNVEQGSRVWYRYKVSIGSLVGTVDDLILTDVLPEKVSYDSKIKIFSLEGYDITSDFNISNYSDRLYISNGEMSGQEFWVYYSSIVSDDASVENNPYINTVTAECDKADSVKDVAKVNVMPAPQLSIEKYTDKDTYTVNEVGHYTIEITNVIEDSLAKDIQVWDLIEDKVDFKNNTITATLVKSGEAEGESLVVDEDDYDNPINGNDGIGIDFYVGGQNASSDEIPDLEYGDKLIVEYDVVYQEVGTVLNIAAAYASNANYVETENIVTVKDSNTEIAIDKYVHRDWFNVYENPWYTIDVTNSNEDVVAENITIIDYSDIGLGFDLDNIWVYVDGEYVTPANEPTVTQVYKDGKLMNKLTLENTGIDLAYGQLLTIEYGTTALQEGIINNTAYASADNAPEVSDSDKIIVIEPLVNVRITKKIKVADIHFDHGNPIFIINLKGTDNYGKTINLNKIVEFTEEYVEANTVGDYVEMSVVFEDLIRGKYTASESDVIRYKLSNIESYNMGTVNKANGTILFNMTYSEDNTTAYATFVNDKYEWQRYSDTSRVTNRFNTDFE